MSGPTILLTNDDGIDSVGFQRVYDALADLGDVVAVAPARNRSAVGRAIEPDAKIHEHPLGYAIEGTPAACVVAGVTALDLEVDLVVSGINKGANLGTPILTRSGTIGAAIEAAYMGIPAIAASMYIPFERIEGDFYDHRSAPEEFDVAARATRFLVDRLLDGALDGADYFNLNAPSTDEVTTERIRATLPAIGYYTVAERDGDSLSLRDRQFELLYTDGIDHEPQSDRAAIAAGEISVSPLVLPTRSLDIDALSPFHGALADFGERHNTE